MKASIQYNDFIGTVAADEAEGVSRHFGSRLEGIFKYLKIVKTRLNPIGLTIYGTEKKYLSILW